MVKQYGWRSQHGLTVAVMGTLVVSLSGLDAGLAEAMFSPPILDPDAFKACMENLLYDHNWVPKKRTEISQISAAKVCAGMD
ncbi:MAG TPA: hypothetical protein V6D14_15420 [Coleofasciculaceae cyanobacterium]|jgi:hypothetical protein